jgi:hypothetical protein
MDHQVKIRGFRIELGDVEAALREHPGIGDAAVVARDDSGGNKILAAYYVAGTKPSPTAGELRSFLKTKLPDYMMPSAYMALERFPLTPNGKVDRKALPTPEQRSETGEQQSEPPQGEAEIAVAKIWCEILGVKQVGRQDNFFELGGHSLMATQLITRLSRYHGVEAKLRDIFDSPTLAEMGVWVERKATNKTTTEKRPLAMAVQS